MINGIIKSYSFEKETGFIEATDGKEYFFDISPKIEMSTLGKTHIGVPIIINLIKQK